MIDIKSHNRMAWNYNADQGIKWSVPYSKEVIDRAKEGNLEIFLSPKTPVPKEWIGNIKTKNVLGLAAGGGQQGVILAAAGAKVTLIDISSKQLAKDRETCQHYGLDIRLIETSADDMNAVTSASQDLIINPVSSCFFDQLAPVWKECQRVLKPGGSLITAFINPLAYCFDFEKANRGHFELRYPLPYSDLASLSSKEKERFLRPESPLEFSHSLTDYIRGLNQEGFLVSGLFEDYWDTEEPINRYFPQFINIRACLATAETLL